MSKPENIKEEYIHTSLGLIPKEWEVKKIKDFGQVITGGTPSTNILDNYGDDFLFVSPGDLGNEKYIYKTEKKLSKTGFAISRKYPKGAVLFTCIGSTIGKVGIASKELTSNQQINAILCNEDNSNEFLYYELENRGDEIRLIAGNQAVPIINKSQFENIHVVAPPLKEQKKIADVLGIWDKAIDKLQELITQKELRKKALMQQLFSSKTKLKGLSKKWDYKPISEIAKEISLVNKTEEKLIVLSCTKYNGLVPSLEYFGRKIFSNDLATYKVVPKNHFAYATNHIEEGSIGYQMNYDEALISPMYTVFKTNSRINDDYLFRVLKSPIYIHEYQKRTEGSINRRGGLRWDQFSKIKIPIPEINEQNKISYFFQTLDGEINLLNQQLQQLKLQKKGLMQQLLTGKTRVKL